MKLHLAALGLFASTAIAQAQPSEADKTVAQRVIADAQKQVCQRLTDCTSAQFRYGKMVQYQGRYLACGEISSKSSAGAYQIWIFLVGSSEPPMLEDSLPELTREQIRTGPCAQPTPAGTSNLASAETASAQAAAATTNEVTARQQLNSAAEVIRAFDACIAANVRTEFDRPSDVVAKITPACRLAGSARIKGRGDPVYRDSLSYDPDAQRVLWAVPFAIEDNGMTGTMSSPYDVSNRSEREQLSRHDRSVVDDLGNSYFMLFQIASAGNAKVATFDAENAYGAKTKVLSGSETVYSIAVPTEGNMYRPVPLFSATVANDVARDVVPNLDIEFDWEAQQPCAVCFKAGTVERGTMTAPTFSSPYTLKILHKYVFARITAIKLTDRRTGAVIASGLPSPQ
jgi:hypothetical protein